MPVFEPFEHRDAIARKAKSLLRKQMRAVRATIPTSVLADHSNDLQSRLVQLSVFQQAKTIALCFVPGAQRGVSLSHVDGEARSRGKTVVYPRVNFDDQRVAFYVSASTELESRGLETAEAPSGAPLISPDTIDLIIVPVLAIDPTGVFIGDGSGAYDHALRELVQATSLAVAFEFQLIPEAPRALHDVPVAVVVTEGRVIEARGEQSARNGTFRTSRAAKEVRRAKQPDSVAGPIPCTDCAGGGTRCRIGKHP